MHNSYVNLLDMLEHLTQLFIISHYFNFISATLLFWIEKINSQSSHRQLSTRVSALRVWQLLCNMCWCRYMYSACLVVIKPTQSSWCLPCLKPCTNPPKSWEPYVLSQLESVIRCHVPVARLPPAPCALLLHHMLSSSAVVHFALSLTAFWARRGMGWVWTHVLCGVV